MPLDVDNTRFPPLRGPCSPGTGAGASSPRHETHRNVANSRSFRSAKGLRRHTSVLLQCLFDRFGSVFPQCGLMVFPGVVIVSR